MCRVDALCTCAVRSCLNADDFKDAHPECVLLPLRVAPTKLCLVLALDDRRGEMRTVVPFDNRGVSASSTEEHNASAVSTQNSTTRLYASFML